MLSEKLTDEAAVDALSGVARRWLSERGIEAFVVIEGTRKATGNRYESLPNWIRDAPVSNAESGALARKLLAVLESGEDDEVSTWTAEEINRVSRTTAHILDPVSLAIGGVILIGAILASRVKKIGRVEFYEGIPKGLPEVLETAAKIAVPKA